jgi:hypothetical protein
MGLRPFAKPARRTLVALESVITLLLGVAFTQLGLSYFGGAVSSFGRVFALLGVVLLLVVRASLVPSPVSRTVAVGLVSFVFPFLVDVWPAGTRLRPGLVHQIPQELPD